MEIPGSNHKKIGFSLVIFFSVASKSGIRDIYWVAVTYNRRLMILNTKHKGEPANV